VPADVATSKIPAVDTKPAFCTIASAAFSVSAVVVPVPPVQGCPVVAKTALALAQEKSSVQAAAPEDVSQAAMAFATLLSRVCTTDPLVSRPVVVKVPVLLVIKLVSVTNA
jgi:hypothetical protein